MQALVLLSAASLLAWALTGLLVKLLSGATHRALPTDRGMHTKPTPVGGGLAIVATLVVLLPLVVWPLPRAVTVLLTSLVALSVVSAADHYRPLWPATRLAAQALAVAVMLTELPETLRLTSAPFWLERGGLAVAWLWLINLTNFMDGIDGIAGAEGAAVAVAVGLLLTWQLNSAGSVEATLAWVLAGACLGYLVWNWAPARIFMGDAGSIPLGFLLGWLLFDLALRGAWAAAAVLPLLFVADATITLLRRLLAGERPWRPHRTHFYQRAVVAGASPPRVVGVMTACNAVLVLLALHAAPSRPLATVVAGVAVAGLFLTVLGTWATRRGSD